MNEDIANASVREVFEETGIKTKYLGVLGYRLLTPVKFGCDDIYFVCVLEPETKEINMDKDEISECKWFKLNDFYKLKLNNTQSEIQNMVKSYMKDKKLISRKEMKYNQKSYFFYQ